MIGFTPVNQVRLTNVAIVRLQKRGKRFEIACYKNKILSWRNKLETDISEVLQIGTVFVNVSKGNLASSKDLVEAFGTSDGREVCKEILDKGEIQVSEQERAALHDSIFRDIANIVVEKTINPTTNLPYTVTMIQNAMRQLQFSVNMSKSSKSQALEVIRKLKDVIPITRASMMLRIICLNEHIPSLQEEFEKLGAQIVQKTMQSSVTGLESVFLDIKVDPEHFRRVEELVKVTDDGGRVEILQLRVAGTALSSSFSSTTAMAKEGKTGAENVTIASAATTTATTTSTASTAATMTTENPSMAIKPAAAHRNDRGGEELQDLLAKITGLSDIAEDVEADEEKPSAHFMTAAERRKAKKAAKKEASVDDVCSESTSATETIFMLEASKMGSKQKISRKDKKLEKEMQQEREEQAKQLQSRLVQQQRKQQQQQSDAAAVDEIPDNSVIVANDLVSIAGPAIGESAGTAIDKLQSCNTCGGLFYDSKAYRDHFKSDWHRFNLKRKMKNLPIVPTMEVFLQLSVAELQL